MANDKFAKWTFPLNFGWNILVQICILEKNEKKNFYLHFFHDTAQRIDARNNNDHNTNRRWSQAVVIFCLYLNEHVATMSPRATEHIKDFKSLGWHQCGFISPIASSHKYYGKKNKKNPCHLKWQHKFQEIMFLYRIQQDSKQIHIKSALFTVPLSLQED